MIGKIQKNDEKPMPGKIFKNKQPRNVKSLVSRKKEIKKLDFVETESVFMLISFKKSDRGRF